jgi:hypothetical protein
MKSERISQKSFFSVTLIVGAQIEPTDFDASGLSDPSDGGNIFCSAGRNASFHLLR